MVTGTCSIKSTALLIVIFFTFMVVVSYHRLQVPHILMSSHAKHTETRNERSPPQLSGTSTLYGMRQQSQMAETGPLATAKKICTFSIFKEYISGHDFYPDQGSWTWKVNNTLPHFEPKICQFQYDCNSMPRTYVPECLTRNKIRKILVMGDSQSTRYFEKLGSSVLKVNVSRHQVTPKEPVAHAHVSTRTSTESTDHASYSSWLQLEHRSIMSYLDYTGFPLNEYNLVILFGNNHEFRDFTLRENMIHIRNLTNLLKETLPPNVPFIWVTTTEEFEDYRPEYWKNKVYDDGKYDFHDKIRLVNEVVFNVTKPLMVQEHSNVLPFLDMQSVSRGVVKELNMDGVHMKPLWYDVIISYLLQMLCESDLDRLLAYSGPE